MINGSFVCMEGFMNKKIIYYMMFLALLCPAQIAQGNGIQPSSVATATAEGFQSVGQFLGFVKPTWRSFADQQEQQVEKPIAIRKISEKTITDKSQSMARKSMLINYGVKGAVSLSLLYGAYSLYKNLKAPQVQARAPQLSGITFSPEGFERLKGMVAGVAEQSGSRLAWLKNRGYDLLNAIFLNVTLGVFHQKFGELSNEHSIEWFVGSQTALTSTLEDLRHYIGTLDGQVINENSPGMNRQLLSSASNSLVSQIELILAYIEFRMQGFNADDIVAASQISRYLYKVTEDFAQGMQAVFDAQDNDLKAQKKDFERVFGLFRRELEIALKRYRYLEARA